MWIGMRYGLIKNTYLYWILRYDRFYPLVCDFVCEECAYRNPTETTIYFPEKSSYPIISHLNFKINSNLMHLQYKYVQINSWIL